VILLALQLARGMIANVVAPLGRSATSYVPFLSEGLLCLQRLRLLDQSDGLVNGHYSSENWKDPIHQEVFDPFSPAVDGIT
jgi:hypothetical protein